MTSPSFDSLRCFVQAARLLSFRSAARVVALSPAAFGQRIRLLEEQLGTHLLQRTTRRVLLTESGRRLLPYAERALAATLECARAARGDLGFPPAEIVLGTRYELGLSWIVPLLPRLRVRHPHLTIHVYFGSGPDLLLRVRSATVDCAVTSTRLTDPKLTAVLLHEERYVFVGQPKLLRRRPLGNAGHARQHVLIDANEELPLFRYWRDAPGTGNKDRGNMDSLNFGRILRVGAIAAIRQLVLRGEGVAVLPEYFVASDLRSGKLRRILPRVAALSDHFRLVFRADDPRRGLYEELAASLQQEPLS